MTLARNNDSHASDPPPTGGADGRLEAAYHAFLQQTLDAVCIYDAETKRLLETNPAFCQLLGYTAAEAQELTVYDFLAPDRVHVTVYFQEIMAAGPSSRSERQWRRKDGALIDVQVTASVITQNGRQLVFVLGHDITGRKQAEASLRQAEQRYRDLFEEAPAMYVITRLRHDAAHITDCNHLFLSTLGYAREDVINQPLARFLTSTSQLKLHEGGDQRVLETERGPEERHLLARDGRVIPALLRATPETDLRGQTTGTRAMFIDMTEVRRAEAAARASARLDDLTRLAASALDFRSTAQMLADRLGELTGADACYLAFWDEARQRLVPTAASGPLRQTYAEMKFKPGETTLVDAAMKAGGVLTAEDVFNSAWVSPAAAARFPTRSALALPLTAGERRLGAAEIAYHQPRQFPPEAIALAERAAGPLALALAKARLFEDLQESHHRLAAAYDATLEGLAVALELRDKETEGHTRRVTEMTLRLARELNLPESDLVHLRRGALLHDIGKIGIPDDILRKPGPLTEAEMAIMRKHPTYAYEVISAIPFLYPAIDIPYCHHEKWDGSGYPRGLQDEAIPLAARIFSVVDVWDALRTERPYRGGWPREKVIDHIRLLSGSHFDPVVVNAFLKLLASDPELESEPPA